MTRKEVVPSKTESGFYFIHRWTEWNNEAVRIRLGFVLFVFFRGQIVCTDRALGGDRRKRLLKRTIHRASP